ncbi:hypothetical protein [Mucilaginibacter sp. BT774]|uniref:hypothetical protein n=1 Tax=Mucilaginibacter sp. BT774 TaxID=3062276 RepID=UPI002676E3C3|nr:hypothetical protein [Mucilaginibacter sp. BT774]MDO3628868.1 hypothetical protein [Mucilaginibacter sp. BT774]
MVITRALFRYIIVLFLQVACASLSYGQSAINWTGTTSSDWATASNWSTNSVPGATDNVQIGVITFNGANQPVISSNVQVGSITFGGSAPVSLTVASGFLLQVTGNIVEQHSDSDIAPLVTLTGAGSVTCASLVVGNVIMPKLVRNKATVFQSNVAALTITGNLIIKSSSIDLLSGGLAHNNSTFSLEGGVLTINGTITTTNISPAYLPAFSGDKPLSKFVININSNQNATLKLQNSNALSVSNPNYASIDFYNYVSGTGTSTVEYGGGNQQIYTNTTHVIDSLPHLYQNLSVSGTGNKIVGFSNNNNLDIGGNLYITGGALDLNTYTTTTTVGGNFSNRSTVTFGANTTTFNGGTFFNSGTFTVGTGATLFSGNSAQSLTDSTQNGTFFRKLGFNNSGAKSIVSGNFAVMSSGKIRMSNSAAVSVASAATLTLKADSTGYASIAALASGCSISGQVNVEQYIQGSVYLNNTSARGYRVFSSPVNYTGTLSGDRNFAMGYLHGTNNYNGIYTTGLSGGGFDAAGNPTIYLLREDIAVCNSSFACGNNKPIGQINNADPHLIGTMQRFTTTYVVDTTVTLPVATGVLFFFRGNRVLNNGTTAGTKTTSPYNYPEDVTLTNTGTINQGDVQAKDWFRSDHYLSYTNSAVISNSGLRGTNRVGNPYPAPINWDNFSATDSTSPIYGPNLNTTIYIINPASSQYSTYKATPSHDRTQVYAGTGIATNIIQSGYGFDVLVNDTVPNNPHAATLLFRETAKFDPDAAASGSVGTFAVAGNRQVLMTAKSGASVISSSKFTVKTASARNVANPAKVLPKSQLTSLSAKPVSVNIAPEQNIRLKLHAVDDTVRDDDILIRFDAAAQNKYNPAEDAYDLGGTDEAKVMLSSYSSNHTPLAINTLPLPARSISIGLYTNAVESGTYVLRASAIKNIPANYHIILKDKIKGSVVDLRLQPRYVFTIDKANKSSFGDRFDLLISLN